MNHVAFFSSLFVKKRKKKAISDRESAALCTTSALSGVESPTREPVFPLAWYMCRLPPAPKPRVLTEPPPHTHTHTATGTHGSGFPVAPMPRPPSETAALSADPRAAPGRPLAPTKHADAVTSHRPKFPRSVVVRVTAMNRNGTRWWERLFLFALRLLTSRGASSFLFG